MSYTATKYLVPKAFPFPAGFDNSQKLIWLRGNLIENDTSTMYCPGGIGSTSFEVTAFSATGLVTYSALVGMPLYNGQIVVVYNTASNTNDGTYIVSALTLSTSTPATAGTFIAVPLPGKSLAASAQTSQTAEGVGQIQWGQRSYIPQTFTVTAVAFSGGVSTLTYTTLVGPQIRPEELVVIAGMTNAGNNGTFSVVTATATSSTAGSFTINNASGVATDSGTGTGNLESGIGAYNSSSAPVQVNIFTSKGWQYVWNATNQTVQIFTTGSASGNIFLEAALGASVAFDNTITFETVLIRSKS